MLWIRFSLLLIAGWGLGCFALESVPTAVLALPGASLDPERPIFGGAAVLIDRSGLAITLEEALVDPQAATMSVVLSGGERTQGRIVRRATDGSTAVLLQISMSATSAEPMRLAQSASARMGDTVWSVGSPFGSLAIDGRAVMSRGIISAVTEISSDTPPARGRAGVILSNYRGPVFETTAAINDGNQGGALVDDSGALLGLTSLGVARERRMGTAVPIDRILAALKLEPSKQPSAGQTDPIVQRLAREATKAAKYLALVVFDRPVGPGNPDMIPRPEPITQATPAYLRKALQEKWDLYYHQQQVWRIDQPVSAIVVDAKNGLLVTAASNLHGGASAGQILMPDGARIPVYVKDIAEDLDLVLLKATLPLPQSQVQWAAKDSLHRGDPLAVVAALRQGQVTMTTGICSAEDRDPEGFHGGSLIQTDALANYGSLGGALIDLDGFAQGMIAFLGPERPWVSNCGVAMALPAEAITDAIPKLLKTKVGLGIRLDNGLRVLAVLPATGAEAAGLKVGDDLLSLDGKTLRRASDLVEGLKARTAGEVVKLRIRRLSEELDCPLTLKEF
jgi:S1-C subfamily serine protease